MKRFVMPMAVAAMAFAVLIVASGNAQTGPGRTLTLFEDVPHESSALVDNAPRSPAKSPDSRRFRLSAGDELTGRTPVLERRGGDRIGTAYVHAVVVKGRTFEHATLEADVVIALRDGTIALTGLAGADQRPFAVVGGTGAYEGARGSATEGEETAAGTELIVQVMP